MRLINAMVQASLPLLVIALSSPVSAQNATSDANAAPKNYRQIIVRYLQATEHAPYIRRALISQPYEEWMGLFNGGHRPAVCVEVYRETPLFAEGRDIWIFSFQDGQIANAGYGYPGPGCENLSSLNEVIKQKQ